jgi:hypothetical protein
MLDGVADLGRGALLVHGVAVNLVAQNDLNTTPTAVTPHYTTLFLIMSLYLWSVLKPKQ